MKYIRAVQETEKEIILWVVLRRIINNLFCNCMTKIWIYMNKFDCDINEKNTTESHVVPVPPKSFFLALDRFKPDLF